MKNFKLSLFGVLTASLAMLMGGCGKQGNLTERLSTVDDRDLSGIAGPRSGQATAAARVPRGVYGTARTLDTLAYPGLNDEERRAINKAFDFFINEHTAEEGVGPVFNQNRCLGCHLNAQDIPGSTALLTVATPASRAGRTGPTDYSAISDTNAPPTAAFTLFGDYSPASGLFDPLAVFGGPIQHVRANGGCLPDIIPPETVDPNLQGGIDPVTGTSQLGFRRAQGERAAPPYIGRGLIEAIFAGDIVANDDPNDAINTASSLLPPPGPECLADCISGRHNENRADTAFLGGDPVVRVSRFGLRAAGPTLFQFMIGGTQGEIGMTSPFAPVEQNNNQNVGRDCDKAPDPELKAEDIVGLRNLIRMISLPDVDSRLLETPANSPGAADIQAGAELFGVDLITFRSRMVPGATPIGTGPDAEKGIAADRKLNCVGCHIPIMATGTSPSAVGARHLSNKYFPIFSDLLLHDMGQIRQGRNDSVPPKPSQEISRNLADFALPSQGVASGKEWRTPPLMGIGRVGPPFLHDIRVFLNPSRPARTVATDSERTNYPLIVTDFETALGAAIELHDLPDPASGCPQAGAVPNDTCPAIGETGGFRSEARLSMQKWRRLSPRQQLQVILFLKSL